MIEFLASLHTYDQEETTQTVWKWIRDFFNNEEGICYYKHPVLKITTGIVAELTLLLRNNHPLAIRCLPYQIDEISEANEDSWTVNGESHESPILELEDFTVVLRSKFQRDRSLRGRVEPKAVLALPLISRSDFEKKFGQLLRDTTVVWADGDVSSLRFSLNETLSDEDWRRARAVFQGVTPLTISSSKASLNVNKLGDAIRLLDRQIALLDGEQEKVALQVAPGPQQIRGLAGTGKTVLLAMKVANIHLHYPDKKILFTFHTRSLYNQAKSLITKFYRVHSDEDPDWDYVHIRHSWGGSDRPGVYSDLSARQGVKPLTLDEARTQDYTDPFKACCKGALRLQIIPEYDYILVDEAQDMPNEFFQILYKLTHAPHQIYWAFDELQSLVSLEIPSPEERFGTDEHGNPRVVFDGQDYPSGIEKDLILNKSYRCPQKILMLAHAIGLGLYNPYGGCVQMLESRESWEAIGYEIESGTLQKGEQVVVYRPPENSPNRITEIYTGDQDLVITRVFDDRESEIEWIADSINRDVNEEGVTPEKIVVITLNPRRDAVRSYLSTLQASLLKYGIASTIPGVLDSSDAFAEPGHVTLTSIFRAKGNEAHIVYILSFESLYDFVEGARNRNQAFTSISRSKAWLRISGVGKKMEIAANEIQKILSDQPRFRFEFPDMEEIRRLDSETNRRRRDKADATSAIEKLRKIDKRAVAAAIEDDPSIAEELRKLLDEVDNET